MDQPPKNDETLPTAVIADRVSEFLFLDRDRVKFIFRNEQDKKFALDFDIKVAVVLLRMCSRIIAQYHAAKPDKGAFFHGSIGGDALESQEVSVSAFNELRGMVGIQFEGSISYLLSMDTALKMSQLLIQTVEHQETPDERKARLARNHPTIAVPRQRIIRP